MTTPRWGTLAELKTAMGVTVSTDDTDLTRALSAACGAIGLACGRDFAVPAGAATARQYVPLGELVYIDDLADSTGLAIDNGGTAVTLSTVQYEPLNGIGPNGVAGWPITRIRAITTEWYTYRQQATVTVTSAKWGWTATPDAVLDATYLLAKDVFNAGQVQYGSRVTEFGQTVEPLIVNANQTVADLLAPFRRSRKPAGTITVSV